MPKVSVILTSYNHEKYIRQAIESVLAQTFTDYELFIVDDCSTDNSWDIIKSYDDTRIIAIRNDVNKRMSIFYNLHRFTGKYVAIHHSDDIWEPDKLQKQVDYLDSHTETTACFTHVQIIDEKGDDFIPPDGDIYHSVFVQPNRNRYEWLRYFLENGNALCHSSVLIRKEAYEEYNLLSSGLFQTSDFLMWFRLCINCEIHIIQEKLTKFRLHTKTQINVSGDKPGTHIRIATENFLVCDDLFRISDEKIFKKVFPEYNGRDIIPEFILSRIMLKTSNLPYQLYGLNRIFKLLNDPYKAGNLKNLHNYTYKEFTKDTIMYDVFSVKSSFIYVYASLYINYGNGYSEHDKLSQSVYIRNTKEFNVSFNISDKRYISGIKLCIDEVNEWEINIDSVYIDGVMQTINRSNFAFTENHLSLFSEPQKVTKIEITGQIHAKLNKSDVNLFIEKAVWFDYIREVYIYGAGIVSKQYYNILRARDINVRGFIVSKGHKKSERYLDIPIYELGDLTNKRNDLNIVIAVRKDLYNTIRNTLENEGFWGVLN